MHEAGIAASILEIAEAEARQRGARAISAVKVKVGDFSGVVPDALQFAFEALRADTIAGDAKLIIERVPISAWCPACQQESRPDADLILWCPRCGVPLEVRAGQELDVEYIDLEEGEPAWNESLSSNAF